MQSSIKWTQQHARDNLAQLYDPTKKLTWVKAHDYFNGIIRVEFFYGGIDITYDATYATVKHTRLNHVGVSMSSPEMLATVLQRLKDYIENE